MEQIKFDLLLQPTDSCGNDKKAFDCSAVYSDFQCIPFMPCHVFLQADDVPHIHPYCAPCS